MARPIGEPFFRIEILKVPEIARRESASNGSISSHHQPSIAEASSFIRGITYNLSNINRQIMPYRKFLSSVRGNYLSPRFENRNLYQRVTHTHTHTLLTCRNEIRPVMVGCIKLPSPVTTLVTPLLFYNLCETPSLSPLSLSRYLSRPHHHEIP